MKIKNDAFTLDFDGSLNAGAADTRSLPVAVERLIVAD